MAYVLMKLYHARIRLFPAFPPRRRPWGEVIPSLFYLFIYLLCHHTYTFIGWETTTAIANYSGPQKRVFTKKGFHFFKGFSLVSIYQTDIS
jgi:hypothetical protein